MSIIVFNMNWKNIALIFGSFLIALSYIFSFFIFLQLTTYGTASQFLICPIPFGFRAAIIGIIIRQKYNMRAGTYVVFFGVLSIILPYVLNYTFYNAILLIF